MAHLSAPVADEPPAPRATPPWYRDAKLGIFVHWGLYSVPAYAPRDSGDYPSFMHDLLAMKDTGGRMPYAEWYLNGLRIPGSPTALHHAATYGASTPYADFRRPFDKAAARVDLGSWASLFADIGARYVVMVTRHLDGYPLWPTSVANPNAPAGYHADRDLVGDLAAAVRNAGLRMGLYYAGGIDWTFTNRPIRTMTDLMRSQALGPTYAAYAAAQWHELIDRYHPSILWNDMGWPAEVDPRTLFDAAYRADPESLVNDRWTQLKLPGNSLVRGADLAFMGLVLRVLARRGEGIPTPAATIPFDIETHEYEAPAAPIERTWELTRGLGASFGYNAEETAADLLTGTQLVRLLVDVVSKGGNLLINVGPDGEGRIPPIQERPVRELGAWLRANGGAIYGTHPWTPAASATADGSDVRFTAKGGLVNMIVFADRLPDALVVRGLAPAAGSPIRLLGDDRPLDWSRAGDAVRICLPSVPDAAAHVLTFAPDTSAADAPHA